MEISLLKVSVTHQLPLEEFEKGFDLMKKGDKSLKVILNHKNLGGEGKAYEDEHIRA